MKILFLTSAVLMGMVATGCSTPTAGTEQVGLLFRHLGRPGQETGKLVHVDLLLPGDTIHGFYNKSGLDDGSLPASYLKKYEGLVADLPWFRIHRPQYVDPEVARTFREKEEHRPIVTLWVKIPATPAQADKLAQAWNRLRRDPPAYRAVGANCSSILAKTLIDAGLLRGTILGGLPGIDRPGSLLKQVRKQHGEHLNSRTGFFGINASGKATMVAE